MFLYPPRPEKAIVPQLIKHFEVNGFWAQIKKNGTCTSIYINDKGEVTWRTRHGEPHRAWSPDEATNTFFSKFRNCCFAAELLHSKGGSKNTLYLFDIVRWENENLACSFADRQKILQKIIPFPKNILIAKNYTKDLTGLFHSLKSIDDEGVVLKNPSSLLKPCYREGLNSDWQVKCRRPTKNYGF